MGKALNMVLLKEYYEYLENILRYKTDKYHTEQVWEIIGYQKELIDEFRLKLPFMDQLQIDNIAMVISSYHSDFLGWIEPFPQKEIIQDLIDRSEYLISYLNQFGIFDYLPEDNPISVMLYRSDIDQKESENEILSSPYIPFKEGVTKEKVNNWLSKALELKEGIDPISKSHKKTYLKRIVAFMIKEFTSLGCNPKNKNLIKVEFEFPKEYLSKEYFDYSGKLKFDVSNKFNKEIEVLAKEIVWIS